MYANELARIYNNLGICFNRSKIEGGDPEKAEQFFLKALALKPDLYKALMNLATVYLNKGGKDNYKKAYGIALAQWGKQETKEAMTFQTLIWSIYFYQSPTEAIQFYEKSEESKLLVRNNVQLLNLMGTMYLEVQDLKKANDIVENGLELSPNDPANLLLKARVLIGRAQKENVIPSFFEIVPIFRDYEDIEQALKLLERTLESIRGDNNLFLETQIKKDIFLCSIWLRRANEARYRDLRKSIDDARLAPHQLQQLRAQDFAVELQLRNFENAYVLFTQSPYLGKMEYIEKVRIAHVFLLRGAPQQTKSILKQLGGEAEQKKDIQYWIDMCYAEILLDNKNLAIKAAEKAKEFAKGTNLEKKTLSHYNALMLRYASSGEVDRLMAGMFEYENKYPGEKILVKMKAIDDQGNLTEELESTILKQKEWYEGIRQAFRSQAIPSYFLEKMLGRPFSSVLSSQHDPEFTIELTIPEVSFVKEMSENLNNTQDIVFDYASLLNLSKMNLLGHLEKLGKHLYVTESLFNKVQEELLTTEQEELRRLWLYLSSSKEIEVIEESNVLLNDPRISELFDQWIVDSIKLSEVKKATFVADDFRFLKILKYINIKGCNSFIILQTFLAQGWIDRKIYSTSVGDLAERCYTFLGFNGDDLFHVVMEDSSKITLRSFHLINQLFLPGSIVKSFTVVFVRFIELLWATGSLPEDKLQWLTFLTNKIFEFVDKLGGVQDNIELEEMVPGFTQMWFIAVQHSNKDEITLLEKKVEEILIKSYLADFKDNVYALIKTRKDSLIQRHSNQ